MSPLEFVLFLSYLPALYFYFASASGASVDFQLATADPNHLTLECYSRTTGDVDVGATIEFFANEDAASHGSLVVPATFDIEPDTEAFFRCTSSDDTSSQSDFVAIAGKLGDYGGIWT